MSRVRMYSSGACPFCVMAKRLLGAKGVGFEEIRVDHDYSRREEMMRITGRRTVPQIFIGETHVGGSDDLHDLEQRGELDRLLQ